MEPKAEFIEVMAGDLCPLLRGAPLYHGYHGFSIEAEGSWKNRRILTLRPVGYSKEYWYIVLNDGGIEQFLKRGIALNNVPDVFRAWHEDQTVFKVICKEFPVKNGYWVEPEWSKDAVDRKLTIKRDAKLPVIKPVVIPPRYTTELVCVYFIQAGDSGPVKIGKTNDVNKRLRALQTAHADTLHVRHVLNDVSAVMETRLHERFAEHRIRGEWFKPDVIQAILDDKSTGR